MDQTAELYSNNLLSFKKSLTQAEMQQEILRIEEFIKNNNLKGTGQLPCRCLHLN